MDQFLQITIEVSLKTRHRKLRRRFCVQIDSAEMFPSSSDFSFSPSSLFSAYASLTGFLMIFRSMLRDFVSEKLRSYFAGLFERFFTPKSKNLTVVINEKFKFKINQVFDAAEIYLRNKISPETERLRVAKTPKQKHFTILMEKGEEISDSFEGFEVKWRYVQSENESTAEKQSEEIKRNLRVVKLYSQKVNGRGDKDGCAGGDWGCISLDHPSTFDTLAMDPGAKKKIIDDLERFLKRREFYKRVGKAWKRGYLLYGPPRTGKSSLIAAMANYLKFDIFDIELSSIYDNGDLKRVLLSTTSRSILEIEDIDCSTTEVKDREAENQEDEKTDTKVTLSGILNFIDGLWSNFGDERIFVFTTNHKERLDPALLHPGRMDMHIHMSYCFGIAFRTLVSNYLGLDGLNHPLCEEIERLIDSTEVTPAELAEELMQDDDTDVLRRVLSFC
ncbi:unnamed protein product [Thlaspi arvense]|uniref:AAA+ ATPase domain-containing protein n=1 Tax=Thlaspi arvense TaxID=13288 RepID=A0AAU9RTZ9_THLAR|nr:unnamed protein product [Thlaspi arvense]